MFLAWRADPAPQTPQGAPQVDESDRPIWSRTLGEAISAPLRPPLRLAARGGESCNPPRPKGSVTENCVSGS